MLAFEVTKLIHGEEEAIKAQNAARALFRDGADLTSVPQTQISREQIAEGMEILELLMLTGLTASKSEGRRLIKQGGIYVANSRVDDIDMKITAKDFDEDSSLLLKKRQKGLSHGKTVLNINGCLDIEPTIIKTPIVLSQHRHLRSRHRNEINL